MDEQEHAVIDMTMNERSVRAITSAIEYTLEKWAGEGDIDQEALFKLRTHFRGMVLEFNLMH